MKQCFSFLQDPSLIDEIVIENTYEFANNFEKNKIMINGLFVPEEDNVENKLRNLCYATLKEKYGENVNPKIVERLENELKIIIGKGYSVIYWISYELVKNSNENGYYVGSRGSVGSSFAAFCAKISEVNALEPHYRCPSCRHHEFYENIDEDGFDIPLKKCPICGCDMIGDGHNIPFESFLGTEGAPKVPDIDLNFSGIYQPQAHRFILEKFGQFHAFRAGTIQTLAEKKTQKLVMDYYEMMDEINQVEKKRTLADTL
jgi:DNA polymerase-3 subunit alpha (Gram-positive type)